MTLLDRTALHRTDSWDRNFKVLFPHRPDIRYEKAEGQTVNEDQDCQPDKYLDLSWIKRCLASGAAITPGNRFMSELRPDDFVASINAINAAFIENGYLNSGLRVEHADRDPSGRIRRVTVMLVIGIVENCVRAERELTRGNSEYSRLDRYALRRLGSSCRTRTKPFNTYALERKFRLLTGDDAIDRVEVRMVPSSNKEDWGLAHLEPAAKIGEQDHFVVPNDVVDLWAAVANDRATSVGSIRSSVGAQWRTPLPYLLLRGETGITGGARDYTGAVIANIASDWRAEASVDHSNAAITEPQLRALDIRSKTTGFAATLSFSPLQCPLSPLFGAYGPGVSESLRSRVDTGLSHCPLSVRAADDVPSGWAERRGLSFSITLANRTTDSSLLGEPFSFSPGAVDGHSQALVSRFAADWLEAGRLGSNAERGWTLAVRVALSKGLSGTRSDVTGIPRPSPHFTSLALQWNAAVQLPRQIELTASGSAQWAGGVLYTAERLPIGGVNSVRGFELGSLLADRGGHLSLSLLREFNPSGGRRIDGTRDFDPTRFQLGAFIDSGLGRDLAADKPSFRSIGSTGLIAAWIPSRALHVEVDMALRLNRSPIPYSNALLRNGLSFRVEFRPLELRAHG